MATFKCKMCGGQLEVQEGQSVCTCEFCGTAQTVPHFDNEKKATFFKRAHDLRFKCEFDKAAGVYETIVTEYPNEAEAYWGLVLCKYGIEYVDDPKTKKKIPTCHRTQFASIFDDHDYLSAIRCSDAVAREIYKREANAISKLQNAILEISSKEDPFDVFICYKETDDRGGRTLDSVLAQDIFEELTSAGYKVFFARRTLERKLGSEYEPYIFAALHSAKIMVHVTSSKANSEAVWVRNEWSRYLSLIAEGQKKTLIPCYKGISAYELPDEMKNLQAQDMSKLGAMQDLIYGIKKILKPTGRVVEKAAEDAPISSDASYDALVRKGHTYLKNHKMEQAKRCFEKAIEAAELCGDAYLGLLLCEYQLESLEELLAQSDVDILASENFNLAREFANKSCNETLNKVEEAINQNKKLEKYNQAKTSLETGKYDVAIEQFQELGDFENSQEMVLECIYQKGQMYFGYINSIRNLGYCDDAINCFNEVIKYKNSKEMIDKVNTSKANIIAEYKADCISRYEIELPKEVTLITLSELVKKVKANRDRTFTPTYDEFNETRASIEASIIKFFIEKTPALIQSFNSIDECSKLRSLCSSIEKDNNLKVVYPLIKQRESEIKEQQAVLRKKKRKKTLKITAIISSALAVAVATFFGIKAIVEENNRKATYSTAEKAMESGNYDDAITYYESLGNYQESQKKIKVCEGLKQLEASIETKKESDAVKGIKTIVSAGEKVDVTYETENNVNIKRLAGGNSGNKTETIDSVNFSFYQPTWSGYDFLNWNSDSLSYKNNRTYLGLMSNWSLNTYSITYVLDGGINNSNNPKKYTVESPDLELLAPSKDHYQFKGWRLGSLSGDKITKIAHGSYGDKTLYATWEINKYDVNFFNEDILLETVKVEHGGTAVYSGATPTKEKTAEFSYTFSGWDKPLTNITQDTNVYAQYDSTINSYRVTFYDYDRTTILDSSTVEYGSNAVFTKATPTRATDDQYEYTFSGWDKPLSTTIIGDTDFYAVYSTKNRYLCRFFVDDVETYSTRVTEGENVTYKGEYPTREQTQEYVFDFMNWDKSLENIQEDTDFNAVFNYIPREYEVKFVNWDGTVLLETQVAYGCYSSYSGNVPTRPTDNDYVYTFNGWNNDPETTAIVEDTVFVAQYSTTDRYLCIFNNYDGTELYREYVTSGENAHYVGNTPQKEGNQQYSYIFAGWDKPLTNIQTITTFIAQFNEITNQYTVTFVNWDGSVLGSSTVDYGTSATYTGSTPTRDADNTYAYTFSGWDISLDNITADVTATAQYSTTDRYLVRFLNYDSSLLYSEYVTEGESANYVGDTPTKPRTQQYSYTFSGWDKPLTNITEETDITAQFNSTVNKYTVTFLNWDGTVLDTDTVDYGSSATYGGEIPTKPTASTGYTFDGQWTTENNGSVFDDLTNVIADRTVYAHYTFATYKKVELNPYNGSNSAFITEDGRLFMFGDNGNMQCGTPVSYDQGYLKRVNGNEVIVEGEKFKDVAIGTNSPYTLALTESGKVYAWGCGSYYVLGDGTDKYYDGGTNNSRYTPVQILNTDGIVFTKILPYTQCAFALTDDGTIYSWGASNMRLRKNDESHILTPLPINSSVKFKDIKRTNDCIVALSVDGDIYAWGGNGYQELGPTYGKDNYTWMTNISQTITMISDGITKFSKISTTGRKVAAITSEGELYMSGYDNSYGFLLAECDEGFQSASLKTTNITGVTDVCLGNEHGLLVKDGKAYSWGWNKYGALGIDKSENDVWCSSELVELSDSYDTSNPLLLACGDQTSCLITCDGKVLVWGYQHYYILSNGVDQPMGNFLLEPSMVIYKG